MQFPKAINKQQRLRVRQLQIRQVLSSSEIYFLLIFISKLKEIGHFSINIFFSYADT